MWYGIALVTGTKLKNQNWISSPTGHISVSHTSPSSDISAKYHPKDWLSVIFREHQQAASFSYSDLVPKTSVKFYISKIEWTGPQIHITQKFHHHHIDYGDISCTSLTDAAKTTEDMSILKQCKHPSTLKQQGPSKNMKRQSMLVFYVCNQIWQQILRFNIYHS